ncbi:cellular nucleic acid-binding protein, partial [Trifolium pratense]
GRNDQAIADAMAAMAQALAQANDVAARHVSTRCEKPKKGSKTSPTIVRVFALSGKEEEADQDNLIHGTCSINNVPLITIIVTGTTHSYIALVCARSLNLVISPMREKQSAYQHGGA